MANVDIGTLRKSYEKLRHNEIIGLQSVFNNYEHSRRKLAEEVLGKISSFEKFKGTGIKDVIQFPWLKSLEQVKEDCNTIITSKRIEGV